MIACLTFFVSGGINWHHVHSTGQKNPYSIVRFVCCNQHVEPPREVILKFLRLGAAKNKSMREMLLHHIEVA
jgi:hypothetical protein